MMKKGAAANDDEDISDWTSDAAAAAGQMLARKAADALLRRVHDAGYRNPFYETYIGTGVLVEVIKRNVHDEETLRELVLAHVAALSKMFPTIIQYEPAPRGAGATVS
jgi:hypothetical protein